MDELSLPASTEIPQYDPNQYQDFQQDQPPKASMKPLIIGIIIAVVLIVFCIILAVVFKISDNELLDNHLLLTKEDFINAGYDKSYNLIMGDTTQIRPAFKRFTFDYDISIEFNNAIVKDVKSELDIIYFDSKENILEIKYDIKNIVIPKKTTFTVMFAQRFKPKTPLIGAPVNVLSYAMISNEYFDVVKPLLKLKSLAPK